MLPEGSDSTFFEQFIEENEVQHAAALNNLAGQLDTFAHDLGARDHFFRHEAPIGGWAHALRDDEGKLRLYCIRYGSCLIVLGSGAPKPKGVGAWQTDPLLKPKVEATIAVADAIQEKIKEGDLKFSSDGFDFEGDLIFNDHDNE